MGKVHDRIDDHIRAFISEQLMFFVGTAPVEGGHVNVSPKGYSVPYLEPVGERPVLDKLHESRSDEKWAVRVAGVNAASIDGLPALEPDHPLPGTVLR